MTELPGSADGNRPGMLDTFNSLSVKSVQEPKPSVEASVNEAVPLSFDPENGLCYIPVRINGHEIPAILDTGAHDIMLTEEAVKLVKLEGKTADTLSGIQGNEPAFSGVVRSLDVAGNEFSRVSVFEMLGHKMSGIGTRLFAQSKLILDFAGKKMMLVPSASKNAPAPNGKIVTLPFKNVDGQIYLPIHILNQSAWACLDSGCPLNLMSLEAAEPAIKLLPPSQVSSTTGNEKLGIGNGQREVKWKIFGNAVPISVDSIPNGPAVDTTCQMANSLAAANQDPDGPHYSVVLGLQFLLQYQKVTIDYGMNTITLQYPENGAHSSFKPVLLTAILPGSDKPAFPGFEWKTSGYFRVEVPTAQTSAKWAQEDIAARKASKLAASSQNAANSILLDGVSFNVPSGTALAEKQDGGIGIENVGSVSAGGVNATINGSAWTYPAQYTTLIRSDGMVVFLLPHASYSLKRDQMNSDIQASSAAPKTTIVVTTKTTTSGVAQAATPPNVVTVDATMLTLPPGYGAVKDANGVLTPKLVGTMQPDGSVGATINEKPWVYPRYFVPIIFSDGTIEFKRARSSDHG